MLSASEAVYNSSPRPLSSRFTLFSDGRNQNVSAHVPVIIVQRVHHCVRGQLRSVHPLWQASLVLRRSATHTPSVGVYLAISAANLSLLRKKRYNILLSYSIVQLVLTTLYFAISLYAAPAQSLAIFNIVGSYGPNALSPWPMVIVNVMFVLNTWASDAFLVRSVSVFSLARDTESSI